MSVWIWKRAIRGCYPEIEIQKKGTADFEATEEMVLVELDRFKVTRGTSQVLL